MNRIGTSASLIGALALAGFFPASASAQFKNGNQTVILNLPRVSPRAELTQRIGLTDVTIVYHRPAADGRKVFGDLVPYGRIWRTGANDNTTIELRDPVTVEGQTLPAGRYGLHTIPGETEWTVIFSKNSTSWGSFSYDPGEDALRVKVASTQGAFREEVTFEFSELETDSATLTLSWESVVVPIHLSVDTKTITLASLSNELRHLPGYKPEAWFEAALYCLDNGFDEPEPLRWIDQAIQLAGETFDNLDLKAQIVARLGQVAKAAELQAEALRIASPNDMYSYGDRQLREKNLEEASRVFHQLTSEHPEEWLGWYGLARVQVLQEDRVGAKSSLEQALSRAAQPGQKGGIRRMLERLAAGQTIG